MPRAKSMVKKSKQKSATANKRKVCTNCNRDLPLLDFYTVSNPLLSSDGKYVNICKECFKSSSLNIDGSLNIDKFKNALMLIDRPFIPAAIDAAAKRVAGYVEGSRKKRYDLIGAYMQIIGITAHYSKLSYLEGEELVKNNPDLAQMGTLDPNNMPRYTAEKKKETASVNDKSFEVTDEILDRFGEGYRKNQYFKMQKKYDKLKQNYQLTTNLHEEALATYVRFKVKEEEATAAGDVGSAEKWNKAAQDAAEKAKLTPKQLTQADLQGGVTAISELSKAVEEAVDIIEILPRFKYAPNDAPDFIIWCYINFCRKLRGLPTVDYSEVYEFYDKKKEEYIAQYGDPYGIFTGDTAEKNRDTVNKFIQLPQDYNSDGDSDGK
jgi:hypothetical protein